MGNQDIKTQDSVSSDEEKISGMLGALKRVEAPGDFDFRVRARIAAGTPVEKASSWLPASIRYAIPLALLMFVGGYFAFNAVYLTSQIDVPVIAGVQSEDAAPVPETGLNDAAPLPVNETIAERAEVKPADVIDRNFTKESQKRVSTTNPRPDRSIGGSYDTAIKPTVSLTPAGNDSNLNLPQDPKAPSSVVRSSAKDFLTSIGVNASLAGSGGRVQSVSGKAAEAGVRVGDVIESVDAQSGNIRIRRDGKSIQISIK